MINRLHITSGFKNGRSWLKDTFFTRPFRVANVGEHRADPALYLMVMSSSPGMLDGDDYDIEITVEEGSRLQLQSQSYQRLFNMQRGARQQQRITLQQNSIFSYVPHPVVPHGNAIFKGHTVISLSDNCRLTWGDVITCGRKHSGEVFRFTSFHNITEIRHQGRLLVKDNVLLEPSLIPVTGMGQMEGYTHQATLLYINTGSTTPEALPDTLWQLVEGEEGITAGISMPAQHTIVLRILGNGGEQLWGCLRRLQQYLWTMDNLDATQAAPVKTIES